MLPVKQQNDDQLVRKLSKCQHLNVYVSKSVYKVDVRKNYFIRELHGD